ncbi:MAG: hypothetical protein WBF51_06670 [Candidatus Dormiibacterota bacterium]
MGNENIGAVSYNCGTEFEFRIVGAGHFDPDHNLGVQGVGITVGMGLGLVYIMRAAGVSYLVNGYHRAVNLMLAGHSYMPCILTDVDPSLDPAQAFGGEFGVGLSRSVPPATCGDYRLGARVKLRKHHKVINVSWSQTLVPDE